MLKRKQYSITCISNIIIEVNEGLMNNQLCKIHDISPSLLSKWCKNKDNIINILYI